MILIDLRLPKHYYKHHLENAINIPTPLPPLSSKDICKLSRDLYLLLRDFPSDTPILLYCKKGIRAGIARDLLIDMGFTNVQNLGGYDDIIKNNNCIIL